MHRKKVMEETFCCLEYVSVMLISKSIALKQVIYEFYLFPFDQYDWKFQVLKVFFWFFSVLSEGIVEE